MLCFGRWYCLIRWKLSRAVSHQSCWVGHVVYMHSTSLNTFPVTSLKLMLDYSGRVYSIYVRPHAFGIILRSNTLAKR